MGHTRESSFHGQCPNEVKEKLTSMNVEVKQAEGAFIISTDDPQALNDAFKLLNEHEIKGAPMPMVESDEEPRQRQTEDADEVDEDEVEVDDEVEGDDEDDESEGPEEDADDE